MIHLLEQKYGKYFISMILGFGLGTLFKKSCNNNNCFIYKVPDLSKINGKSFKYNNKCFKYDLVPGVCMSTKKQFV
jgi:hypothetical protein